VTKSPVRHKLYRVYTLLIKPQDLKTVCLSYEEMKKGTFVYKKV